MFNLFEVFVLVATLSYASSIKSLRRVEKELSYKHGHHEDKTLCEPNSYPSPTAVTLFKTYFAREVHSREPLKCLMDMEDRISPTEFARGIFYSVSAVFSHMQGINTTTDVYLITKYMAACMDRLPPEILTQLSASSPANFLYSEGVLHKQNAKSLAKKFASILENVVSVVMDEKYPLTKVAAIVFGHAALLNSQCSFNPRQFNKIATMYGNEWTYLIPEKGDGEPVLSSWLSDSNPLMANASIPCWIPLEVTMFSDAFCNSAHKSHLLRSLFRSSPLLTPEETAKGVFYLTLFHHFYHRITKPAQFADFTARFVRELPSLHWKQYARGYANIAGKFLYFEGILNVGNALRLAQDLIQATIKKTEELVDVRHPRSKIVARSFGLTKFVYDMGLFTEDKLPKLTFHLGNEWRCQLLNHKNRKSLVE